MSATIQEQQVPAPTNPVGAIAAVTGDRDLVAEKEAEQARDRAEAAAKRSRFAARKVTSINRPEPSGPEFETLILKAAANNPLSDVADFSTSTFIANTSVLFYLLNFMDHTMAATKRWTDNCMGWVPPISQMYIAVLYYVQVFRAMDAAGAITPGSEISNFLRTFIEIFPLNELWIPGPHVAFFRSISAFWPSEHDQFGNVTPTVPKVPDWSRAGKYRLGNYENLSNIDAMLPNISLFITRLRSLVVAASAANVTQDTFTNGTNSPASVETLFGVVVTNDAQEQWLTRHTGFMFSYADNLSLWQNAARNISRLSIPQDLVGGTTIPVNSWAAFLRFAQTPNEHTWFGPVSAIMAKYCQFFNGSASLDSVAPNCSAAPALKLSPNNGNNIDNGPTFVARAGTGASHQRGDANSEAHYLLRDSARCSFEATLALRGVPDAHVYAAMTYAFNMSTSDAASRAYRLGPFWTLGPNAFENDSIEVLPGVLSTIIREYHSDQRIPATRQ